MSATPSQARLIVLFDADCGICSATAARLCRWDRLGRLELLALQAAADDPRPVIRQVARTHPLHSELHVVDPDSGSVRAGGPAVLELIARLPRGGPVAAVCRWLPFAWIIGVAYAAIARNRHAIGRALRFEQACAAEPR